MLHRFLIFDNTLFRFIIGQRFVVLKNKGEKE